MCTPLPRPRRRSGACRRRARGRGRGRSPRPAPAPASPARALPLGGVDQRIERAGVRVDADDVAVCAPGRAARRRATSGLTWIAAGTLPDAPLMRPSVTSATRKPFFCSAPSGGVSLCSSGMPLARGPWKRTTATKSRSSSPAGERGEHRFLRVEDQRRRLDDPAIGRHRRDLDDRAAAVAGEQLQAALVAERLGRAAHDGRRRRCRPAALARRRRPAAPIGTRV